IRLEGQSPNSKGFPTQDPQLFPYFRYKLLNSSHVDVLHFLEQRKVASEPFPDPNESLKILGETKATEADARIQERLTDTLIAADALGYLGDVGASGLACVGHQIDE